MSELLVDYIILKSDDCFLFKVSHPDFLDKGKSSDEINNLFNELKKFEFDHRSEIILFRTKTNQLGVIGEEFTSWYPASEPRLGIKLVDFQLPNVINLLNMKPAKGPGFCTMEFSPMNREMIFFLLKGNDRNWDHNFKKTDRIIESISKYLQCQKVNVIEQYNA